MLKERVTYVDFDGNERTEDFYFNLTKSELMEMQLTTPGGLAAKIQAAVDSKDVAQIASMFKDIVLRSYGVKSDDGRRFIKNPQLKEEFEQCGAYDVIFNRLYTEDGYAEKFINSVIPVVEEAKPQIPNTVK